tara:strand:+ start:498 stop:683 length:186 start_codon:yes stop_codon:yes gene_type:complete
MYVPMTFKHIDHEPNLESKKPPTKLPEKEPRRLHVESIAVRELKLLSMANHALLTTQCAGQ